MSSVYDSIAEHFHKTRHTPWPGVVEFLKSIPPGSKILDLGCGNGKYLSVREDCTMYGCDPCLPLLNIAKEHHPNAILEQADGTNLPYEDHTFDAVISIAVLHHLQKEAREVFLKEVMRVLKYNGLFLITVWATEAVKPSWTPLGNNDYIVPWCSSTTVHNRFYHLFTKEEASSLVSNCSVKWERDNWYICRVSNSTDVPISCK